MADDDAVLKDALATLAGEDADAARNAEAAIEWLTAAEGLSVLTQERVQTFLWYSLTTKWLTDADHHRRVVNALSPAFDLLGLPRYSALCRSQTTAATLEAHEHSNEEGLKAFRKADAASGIRPPGLPP
jgi:hypothetical protein